MAIIRSTPEKTILKQVVSLSEAKRHLNIIDNDDHDNQIEQIIEAATGAAENHIDKSIAYTRNVINLYKFSGDSFTINEGNLITVESIVSDASVLKTIKNTFINLNDFSVDLDNSVSSDPLIITFTTGYETADKCPTIIKQLILIKIADLFDVERTDYEFSSIKDNRIFERRLDFYKKVIF